MTQTKTNIDRLEMNSILKNIDKGIRNRAKSTFRLLTKFALSMTTNPRAHCIE